MKTAHVDTFARDNLPPREQWPEFQFDLPELQYPERMNCATVLLDDTVRAGHGSRIAIRAPDGECTYAQLLAQANRIANVLVRDMGLTEIVNKAQITHALCDKRLEAELKLAQPNCPSLKRICFWYSDEENSLDNKCKNQADIFQNVDTSAEDVALIFTFGLGGLLCFPLRFGASTALVEKFTPQTLLESIRKFRATILFTAPTMYRALAGIWDNGYDLSSLKKCVSAGEALPAATRQLFKQASGIEIIDGIGATELIHIFISHAPEHAKHGATGHALPGYTATVLDESGQRCAPGPRSRGRCSGTPRSPSAAWSASPTRSAA